MRIAFIWQGFSGRYGQWQDGLYAAMKLIENDPENSVKYFDTTEIGDIEKFAPDFVLYWEAPCTFAGKDRENYWNVQDLPFKKALLFAGGDVKEEWLEGFDLFFVESKCNEEDFERLGKKWKRAFGVNTQIMKPQVQGKAFLGVFQATCASWKRHWLLAEALGAQSAIAGRYQESDPIGFDRARQAGAVVFPELSGEAVAALINSSLAVVNCSAFWGGGQRSTLEAMACGVPVIVMDDSPKNIEYVEESGAGVVVEPTANAIRNAVTELKLDERATKDMGMRGHEYVQSKWTEQHYADAIMEGLRSI